MRRLITGLAILAANSVLAPAGYADYLSGEWYIISNKAKLSTSAAGHPLLKDSAKWVKDGAEVRILALPNDSAWQVRLTNGAWWGVNLPTPLWDKNVELAKAKRNIAAVAFMAQGGWAILYDNGQLASDGVPLAIRTQLQNAIGELQTRKDRPRFLAFAPDGGWVLLGEKDYRSQGVPPALSDSLAAQKKLAVAARWVAFDCRGDWFVITNNNKFLTSNPKHPAAEELKKLQSAREQLSLIAFTPGVYREYVLESQPVRRVQATLSAPFTCDDGAVQRWAVFPAAYPELPRQRGVRLTFTPEATAMQDDGPLKQKVHIIRVEGRPKGFELKVQCEMTLYTNRLVPALAKPGPAKVTLAPADARIFTQVTQDMTTKVFKDFVSKHKLNRDPKETDLEFARRAFLVIAREFTYIVPNPAGKDVIECGKGDCGGLSWVFVRVLRANDIPARLLLGRWAYSETPGKNPAQPPLDPKTHAKVEFFAAGIGWVGADPSGGVTTMAAGNPLTSFGNEAGDFIVTDFDIDRQILIWPDDRPTKLGGTQSFFWWYQGDARNLRGQDHWLVKTLDADPKE